MPFIRKFNTLLYNSKNNIIYIDLNDGITFTLYDSNLSLVFRKQIYKDKSSFVTCHFDIDEKDIIYGLVNTESNILQYINVTNKFLIKNTIAKCEFNKNAIKFPYIKKSNGRINIFYYLLNSQTSHICSLIHRYKDNNKYFQHIIDYIPYDILTNFRIINTNNTLNIFYFKLCDNHEELFMKSYNFKYNMWSDSFQITNTCKSKMYLSVIKDNMNCYHITYSENNYGKYHCCYINGYAELNIFKINTNNVFPQCIACTFPTILYYNNKLYIQWTEYNVLNTICSHDNGKTWGNVKIDTSSMNNSFSCCRFGANIKNNNIIYNFFNQTGFINVLGI